MGVYLNLGNDAFQVIKNGLYVDKTGLLGLVNDTINTVRKLICISRPRRFGKSFATKMMCAYYDKTCDSSEIFDGLKIAAYPTYREHLNQYDVIYLDMTAIIGKTMPQEMIAFITKCVTEEIVESYPNVQVGAALDETLAHMVQLTGNKVIVIIDEWDAPIREWPQIQKQYLYFLRMLFKNSGVTDKVFAAVYMTGILPIKKDGSQSAISDFKEYTMVYPQEFAEYVGFTEEEVKELCRRHNRNFDSMKQWYDGYELRGVGAIYNPNSVVEAIRTDDYRFYWTQTSAADSLMEYISLDYDGLSKTIAELMGGISVEVDPLGFSNDLITFHNRDDVLTLLVHLGYLAFDDKTQKVYIPNEEIKREFAKAIRGVKRDETIRRVRESDQLLADTIHMNAEKVAAQIEKLHREETTALFYNDEQALRSIVKLAYFSYKDYYMKFEELPAGVGFADLVYLPKRDSTFPALLIEMKWNKTAVGAIEQIKNKQYPTAIQDFGGEVLLVGINYDKDAPAGERKHSCVIEKLVR